MQGCLAYLSPAARIHIPLARHLSSLVPLIGVSIGRPRWTKDPSSSLLDCRPTATDRSSSTLLCLPLSIPLALLAARPPIWQGHLMASCGRHLTASWYALSFQDVLCENPLCREPARSLCRSCRTAMQNCYVLTLSFTCTRQPKRLTTSASYKSTHYEPITRQQSVHPLFHIHSWQITSSRIIQWAPRPWEKMIVYGGHLSLLKRLQVRFLCDTAPPTRAAAATSTSKSSTSLY